MNKDLKDLSPEEWSQLSEKMNRAGIERNKTTVAEFQKFRPLFHEPDENISQETYASLHRELYQRFNLYSPIIIFSDNSQDAEIVETIPAFFSPTTTANDVEDGTKVITRFANTMMREDNPVRADREIAASQTMEVLKQFQTSEEVEEQARLWNESIEETDTHDDVVNEEDIEFE